MTELPQGWVDAAIEDCLCPLDDGRLIHQGWSPQCERVPADDVGEWGVLKTTAIQPGAFIAEENKKLPYTMEPRPGIEVRPRDLLLTCAGPRARCGVACLVRDTRPRLMLSGKMYRFRVNERDIDPRFLEAALLSPALVDALDEIKTGISDSGLNLTHSRFRALRIPVAPRPEQGRIIAAIEEAFSKLDAGEAGLRIVRQLLNRLRDEILAAAVAGRLVPQDPSDTPAMKLLVDLGIEALEQENSADLPEGWVRVRVGDIAQVGSGTTPKRGRADYWDGGTVPWVTSGAVSSGVIREPSELVTETALRETSLRLWPAGTLLVAMYGEGQTRGRCAELAIEAACNQACAAISLRPELNAYRRLVRLHFDANYSVNRRLASGGVQPNLSGALIKNMTIALPPIDEVVRIVAEAERQMSFVDACERAVDATLTQSAALRRSVLKAAFEGRLVPQDPTDEPASVLLERIRGEREATLESKRSRAGAKA